MWFVPSGNRCCTGVNHFFSYRSLRIAPGAAMGNWIKKFSSRFIASSFEYPLDKKTAGCIIISRYI